jgi:hypothetical protein
MCASLSGKLWRNEASVVPFHHAYMRTLSRATTRAATLLGGALAPSHQFACATRRERERLEAAASASNGVL